MAMENRTVFGPAHVGGASSSVVILKKRLAKVQRRIAHVENVLEEVAHAVEWVVHDIERTPEGHLPAKVPKNPQAPAALPAASNFSFANRGRVAFEVSGAEYRVDLSPTRMDLIAVLKASTDNGSHDGLVGFKTKAFIVHALRARKRNSTERSVTVEISRLRAALGPANRGLIENRRNRGYRFRLLS